jgi:uncharacterized protein (AIM24 family)
MAFVPTVSFEIQYVGGIRTALFGGEGVFFAKLTGPGPVWLQSLPFSRLASRVFAAAPHGGSVVRSESGFSSGSGLAAGAAAAGLLGSVLGAADD